MLKPIIAMLTDFQDRDGFVGILRGVCYRVDPDALLVDVCHHIPAHNIDHAAWVLHQAIPAFPAHTIFLAVVDPKVACATQHHLVIHLISTQQWLVLPDNGLATWVLEEIPSTASYEAARVRHEWLALNASASCSTFQARDIYAPLAAKLSTWLRSDLAEGQGIQPAMPHLIKAFSDWIEPYPVDQLVRLQMLRAYRDAHTGHVVGQIMRSDVYGNWITNIPHSWLQASGETRLTCLLHASNKVLDQPPLHIFTATLVPSYFDLEDATAIGLVPASHGCLEIAKKQSPMRLPNGSKGVDEPGGDGLIITIIA